MGLGFRGMGLGFRSRKNRGELAAILSREQKQECIWQNGVFL